MNNITYRSNEHFNLQSVFFNQVWIQLGIITKKGLRPYLSLLLHAFELSLSFPVPLFYTIIKALLARDDPLLNYVFGQIFFYPLLRQIFTNNPYKFMNSPYEKDSGRCTLSLSVFAISSNYGRSAHGGPRNRHTRESYNDFLALTM